MAAEGGTGGGLAESAGAHARCRRSQRGGFALQALCAVLLVLCGSCSSDRDPTPLMADSLLLKPVDRGRLSSPFGARHHPILKRRQMHRGIDWAAPRGTPVRAAGHGVVVAAAPLGAYGRYLRIDHGGAIATAYAHLDGYAKGLRPGHAVRQGDLIGAVGNTGRATGPHLHYEILVAGRQVDPLAFTPVLAAQSVAPGSELAIGGPDPGASSRSAAPTSLRAPARLRPRRAGTPPRSRRSPIPPRC
ncbi:MAG: peptidase [Geminicoccaceae bacterium]|nr:peptidase [Geminicoccaceae bacterium]